MKKNYNKTVCVVFNKYYSKILGVFSSQKSLNKQFHIWEDEILKFARSEKVKIKKTKSPTDLGDYETSIEHNIPSYNLIVLQAEITNSQHYEMSDIDSVWVSYSYCNPGAVHVFGTEEEGLSHLKSIDCLQKNEKLKAGTLFEEHKINR